MKRHAVFYIPSRVDLRRNQVPYPWGVCEAPLPEGYPITKEVFVTQGEAMDYAVKVSTPEVLEPA